MDIWIYIAVGVGAYLWGSLSPALIISDQVAKKDVRKYGSGNAGTTNMMRTFGWKLGLLTFALDVVKGVVGALIGGLIAGQIGSCVAGIMVIAGHNWPIYYGFKGGKGIASTLGVLIVLMPVHTALFLVVIIAIILLTKIVSIGSIIGVLGEAAIAFIFYPGKIPVQVAAVVLAALAIFGHRANIVRLINGTENKLNFKKKPTVDLEEKKVENA